MVWRLRKSLEATSISLSPSDTRRSTSSSRTLKPSDCAVTDGASASECGICNPGSRVLTRVIMKFRTNQQWFANGSGGDNLTDPVDAGLEAEILRNAQGHAGAFCCSQHTLAFGGVHRHRLLAQHRFAMLECDENVLEMQRIGGCHKDDVNLGGGAESFGRIVGLK